MTAVFISYVSEDRPYVRRIVRQLESEGLQVWLDRSNIGPGERWQDAISSAIRGGACFLCCFSANLIHKERSYASEELAIAIEEIRLRVLNPGWFIPVRLDDCEIPDLRVDANFSLRSFQWVDLFDDFDGGVRRIAARIKENRRRHRESELKRTRSGTLAIRYPKGLIGFDNPSLYVHVDGNQIGWVSDGKAEEFILKEGRYQLRVEYSARMTVRLYTQGPIPHETQRSYHGESKPFPIEIKPNEILHFRCETRRGFFSVAFSDGRQRRSCSYYRSSSSLAKRRAGSAGKAPNPAQIRSAGRKAKFDDSYTASYTYSARVGNYH